MNPYSQLQKALLPLLLLSFVSNGAVLISPLFMMQVLDRVIPSGNSATLLLLAGLAIAAFVLQAVVEWGRDVTLQRLANWSEGIGSAMVVQGIDHRPLGQSAEPLQQQVQDVAQLSRALSGPTALAALSLPWIPLFAFTLWLIHPAFVMLFVALGLGLWLSQKLGGWASEGLLGLLAQHARMETTLLDRSMADTSGLGNGGIAQNLRQRFLQSQMLRHQAADRMSGWQAGLSAFCSGLRSLGQVVALALGAYLVTLSELSAGGMIAASLIVTRSYGTLEIGISRWGDIRQCRESLNTLRGLQHKPSPGAVAPPDFQGSLRAEGLIVPRGGGAAPILDRVSFSLSPGACLGIVGGSGSGKTCLLRAISGIAPAPIGSVFWDDSEIRGLPPEVLYQQVGYLPQRATLLPGSIADNIAGFALERDDDQVIAAAKSAGVHGLIAALPEAYQSDLSHTPHLLSAGQLQRIALARAIYQQPSYLFLDEPNALLDSDAERALAQTLSRLKSQGTTIVMVLHRSGLMGLADQVLRLDQGRVVDFGPRAEVLARLGGNGRQIRLPLLASSLQDLRDWISAQFTRSTDEPFSQKAQLVGMEMFNIALSAPVEETPRSILLQMKFLNDCECELSMQEDAPSEQEAKMIRVRNQLDQGKTLPEDRPQDEISMAAVTRIAKHFEVRSEEDRTFYRAALTSSETDASQTGGLLN